MAEESFNSILNEICQSKTDHQQQLCQSFHIYTSDKTKQRWDFESQQSSFLDGIKAKLRAVKQALNSTVISVTNNFTTIGATLTKVEGDTARMSVLLEENHSQLHQLRDNKAARVITMLEHRERLDNMDAILIRVSRSIMKTVNLVQEMDSKVSASRPTAADKNRPIEYPLDPGFVSPTRPLPHDGLQPSPVDSVPDPSTTATVDNPDNCDPPVAQSLAPHQLANVNFGPGGLMSQRALSYPSGDQSSSIDHLPPAGPCQVHFKNPTDYRFDDSHPLAVDTSEDHMEPANVGGHIKPPRPSDKECQARNRQTSLFDVARLASLAYHRNHYSIQTINIPFIHTCGYQTILPTAAEDVLLCYQDIQQVHRKVRLGWTNPRTHISGRILEKGLLIFLKLKMLLAKDTVQFYDKLQELSAGYLIPLMTFEVIQLEFNFEGLFVPRLGTECYADCAAALMEVLPRLLPSHDSEVQVAISAVRGKSKNGYDLF